MTEKTVKLKHANGRIHLATFAPNYMGEHYDTLCGLWVNYAYHQQALSKVSDDKEVSCKKCLKKMEKLEIKVKENHDREILIDEMAMRDKDRQMVTEPRQKGMSEG